MSKADCVHKGSTTGVDPDNTLVPTAKQMGSYPLRQVLWPSEFRSKLDAYALHWFRSQKKKGGSK